MLDLDTDDVTVGLDALTRFLRTGNEHFIPDIYFEEDGDLHPIRLPLFDMGA